MSLRLFGTMLFFSVTVLWPIHQVFQPHRDPGHSGSPNSTSIYLSSPFAHRYPDALSLSTVKDKSKHYLWSYLVFTWFFSLLTIYFMNAETFKVVKTRQDYLGTQSTVTDRTFRLTGIPKDLRSETKIKEFVENLQVGHVRSVNLCRNWSEIDRLMARRLKTLRKLEEAWSAYRSQKAMVSRSAIPEGALNDENDQGDEHDEHSVENGRLLAGNGLRGLVGERERPKIRLRFGFLKMRNRKIEYDTWHHVPRRILSGSIGSLYT